jgi:hypothetical protein
VAKGARRWTAANRRVWTGNRSTRLIQRYEGRGGGVGGEGRGKGGGKDGVALVAHSVCVCSVRSVYCFVWWRRATIPMYLSIYFLLRGAVGTNDPTKDVSATVLIPSILNPRPPPSPHPLSFPLALSPRHSLSFLTGAKIDRRGREADIRAPQCVGGGSGETGAGGGGSEGGGRARRGGKTAHFAARTCGVCTVRGNSNPISNPNPQWRMHSPWEP